MSMQEYEISIRSVVPEQIMEQAREIVVARRPENLPVGFEPLNFARILVVEDDVSEAREYQKAGQSAGNEVVIASSADEVAELIAESDFSLIVTDGLFGQWSEVLEAGSQKGVRTVVVSGSEHVIESARSQGAEVIEKYLENYRRIIELFTGS